MENVVLIKTKDGNVVEKSCFQDSNEAYYYYQELVMRQNYGEAKLQDKVFSIKADL